MLDRLSSLKMWEDYAKYSLPTTFDNGREQFYGQVDVVRVPHTYPNGATGEVAKCYIAGMVVWTFYL